jgi:HEAT repeat protein
VLADPDNAMTHLLAMLEKGKPSAVSNAALRILGSIAGVPDTPKAQKDVAVAELIKRTEGMMNNVYYEAAIEGLVRANDSRAVGPLRKMTKGMAKAKEVKRAALRGLALTYKDAGAIEQLKSGLEGGMMSDAEDQLAAAVTLIEAGDQAGFDWASRKLEPKKGGFVKGLMKTKSDIDPVPRLVLTLIDKRGDQSRAVLTKALEGRTAGDGIWAAIHIGLLELGDASHLADVKSVASGDYAASTRMRAATALAAHKDYSGIAALASIAADKRSKPGLRSAVAATLGRIDHPDSVPPLVALLADKDASVRASAAYALARLNTPAALDGIGKAWEAEYERPAIVQAHLLRSATGRFQKEQVKNIAGRAAASQHASVKFLAAAVTPAAAAPPAKKKK